LFFEKDAAMVRQLFEKHVNSLSDTIREDKLELANGRSVHIVSGKTGLTLWFTEKLK